MKKGFNKQFIIDNMAGIMCVVLFALNSIFTNNFFQLSTFWNLLSQTVSYMFVTMGMTLVISTGCTDLSVGAVMAISSCVCGQFILGGGNPYVGILLGISCAIVCGIINGVLVAKFNLQPMVAMLVTRMVYRAGIQIYTSGITQTITCDVGKFLGQSRIAVLGNMPVIVVPMFIVIVISWFIVKKTKFGKEIEAVGNNRRTGYLCGVSVSKTIICVYILSAVFAAIGGLLEVFRTGAMDASTVGIDYEMTAIAAATVGGTSMRGGKAKIAGSVFGALLMTLITMTINFFNISYQYSNILKAIVIVASLALQAKRRD